MMESSTFINQLKSYISRTKHFGLANTHPVEIKLKVEPYWKKFCTNSEDGGNVVQIRKMEELHAYMSVVRRID